MDRTLIRYQVRPQQQDENERLVREVFDALHGQPIEGLRYLAWRLDDGSHFHLVGTEPATPRDALLELAPFRRFQAGVRERCMVQPEAGRITLIGNFRMLADG